MKKQSKFIHEKACIEGDVVIGNNSSVWAFAVLRGDEGKIKVGSNCNIQEHVTLHGKVVIGDNTSIGHNAVIHGAVIGNNVLIGSNATVLDNSKVGDWVIVAAGSVVPPNKNIEEKSVVMGVPAKFVRRLSEKDKNLIIENYQRYLKKIKP